MVKTHNALVEVDGVLMITLSLTAGAIYLVRNPLDVVVSCTHHLGQPTDDIITLMETRGFQSPATAYQVPEHHSDWSTHVESWTAHPHPTLHVVRYEDMSRRPGPTFRAISAFLGLKPPGERLGRAMRHSSFRSLRAGGPHRLCRAHPVAEPLLPCRQDRWLAGGAGQCSGAPRGGASPGPNEPLRLLAFRLQRYA